MFHESDEWVSSDMRESWLDEKLWDDVDLTIFKEYALLTLQEIRKGIEQLMNISPKTIEYRLLITEIERRFLSIKNFIEEILGESFDLEEFDYEPLLDLKREEYLTKMLQLIQKAEEELKRNQIVDAIALILVGYEILETAFCTPCPSDAS